MKIDRSAIYEQNVSTGVTRTYYFAGSQRVAVREGATLTFIVGDHLSSASVILNSGGAKIGEMRYTPFGETRLIIGSVPTDRRYTGQRQESVGLGSLSDYGARFYAPYLNRWLSPDTIVPDPADPQSLNRMAYVVNNPLKYRDPTGHVYDTWANCDTPVSGGQYQTSNGLTNRAGCWKYNQEKNLLEGAGVTGGVLSDVSQNTASLLQALTNAFGVTFSSGRFLFWSGEFNWTEASAMTKAIAQTARVFGISTGNIANGAAVFKSVFNGVDIARAPGECGWGCRSGEASSDHNITLWRTAAVDPNALIHELGHIFDYRVSGYHSSGDTMLGPYGFQKDYINNTLGFSSDYGFGPFYSGDADGVERFADMFLGYVVGGFDLRVDKGPGQLRSVFMQGQMPLWLSQFYP